MAEYYAAWLLLSDAVSRSVSAVKTLLYYLSYPVFQLFRGAALVLSPFIALFRFLLLPLTYAGHAIITLVLLPFRLRLLERLERIYIYLGIAALIGCFAGAILHLSFSYLTSALGIDSVPRLTSREKGRTAAEYRSSKRKDKGERPGLQSIDAKQGASRRKADVEEDDDPL